MLNHPIYNASPLPPTITTLTVNSIAPTWDSRFKDMLLVLGKLDLLQNVMDSPSKEVIPSPVDSQRHVLGQHTREVLNRKSGTELLLESLKGQKIIIPDLWPLYKDWPRGVNKYHAQMVPVVDARIERLGFTGDKLQKLKNADFAMCAGAWWPNAEWDEYRILTFLFLWIFTWDDLFESNCLDHEAGPGLAEKCLRETVLFVRSCLGVGEPGVLPQNPLIRSFDVIAEAMRVAYNEEQRHAVVNGLEAYFKGVQDEQQMVTENTVPPIDRYWNVRINTIAVEPCLAMNEYALNKQVPSYIMRSGSMKILWAECIAGVSIMNDMMSLKKEMHEGTVYNLIPVIYAAHGSVQQAIEASTQLLVCSIERMKIAKEELIAMCEEPEVKENVENYVNLFFAQCTGTLDWSLRTQRYGMAAYIKDNGTLELVL
ncbi:hypothetical protein CROQUDRAFT_663498 [Cronartium quercuum f. sp. fusiforme G11]|uniref:Terpene synthase n=1 Tax=Cronartium quercuum f. sp. fusiforme G11 TaxID=708437 RepID=A0A9P6N8T0_9BASI|nr:hypothetical protein CROQUDRAFT_663498 [Cronartium quercuum f. sp. fusiforme G11]